MLTVLGDNWKGDPIKIFPIGYLVGTEGRYSKQRLVALFHTGDITTSITVGWFSEKNGWNRVYPKTSTFVPLIPLDYAYDPRGKSITRLGEEKDLAATNQTVVFDKDSLDEDDYLDF